jgi:CDP-2,3-bis-(O-geranylgeranyl)-sn-glycerol synthase
MVIKLILSSLYFFLPAYFANMAPIFAKKLKFLHIPIHDKAFGSNKTWRGILVATLMGGLIFWLQKLAFISGFRSLALIEYSDFSIFLGLLLGLGAILGDLVKSYYKRKQDIAPGDPWFVFDQMDFVIGALLLSFFVYVPAAEVALTLLIASPLLHIITNHIGYLLGIRKKRW